MGLNVTLFNKAQGDPNNPAIFVGAPEGKDVYTLRLLPTEDHPEFDSVVVLLPDLTMNLVPASSGEWTVASSSSGVLKVVASQPPFTLTHAKGLDLELKITVPAGTPQTPIKANVHAGAFPWERFCVNVAQWPGQSRAFGDWACVKIENETLFVTCDGESPPRDNSIGIILTSNCKDDIVAEPRGSAQFFAYFDYGADPDDLAPTTDQKPPNPALVADTIRSFVEAGPWKGSGVPDDSKGIPPGKNAQDELPSWCAKPALYWRWEPTGNVALPPRPAVKFRLDRIRVPARADVTDQGFPRLIFGWSNLAGINDGTKVFPLEKKLPPPTIRSFSGEPRLQSNNTLAVRLTWTISPPAKEVCLSRTQLDQMTSKNFWPQSSNCYTDRDIPNTSQFKYTLEVYMSAQDGDKLTDHKEVIVQVSGPMPIGTIVAYYGEPDKIPVGWLPCDGRTCGEMNAMTGSVPDLRGYFLRGLDTSGQVDPGIVLDNGSLAKRSLGSTQGDMVITHTHLMPAVVRPHGEPVLAGGTYSRYNSDDFFTGPPTLGSAPDTRTRVGVETRPKNVAVNYIIYAGLKDETAKT